MQASDQELENLERLQQIDAEVIRNKKKLDGLPQRQTILETRQKLSEVIKKKTQIQDMIDDAEDELHKLLSEDERLAKKQDETQEALERVQGDYRSVESYTKDLHGVAKRREKLTAEMERVDAGLSQVRPLMDQIMAGCAELEAREKEAVASFQEEGGALTRVIAQTEAEHKRLADSLDPALHKAYERACHECGGIGVARLVEGSCSACRTTFDSSRIARIKQDAPVSRCPSCRRLLIVTD